MSGLEASGTINTLSAVLLLSVNVKVAPSAKARDAFPFLLSKFTPYQELSPVTTAKFPLTVTSEPFTTSGAPDCAFS